MNILTIQSHVVYGHAGNSAAVFPMQRLGANVWPINTVQFSNHTQYGKWTGQALPAEEITHLVNGIENIGELKTCTAVLSGYIGDSTQGSHILETVNRIKKANPQAIYLCDPVMGHPEKGCVVKEGIAEYLCSTLIPNADIIAPNQLELATLTDMPIHSIADAVVAARKALLLGPKIVLVKHLNYAGKPADRFESIVVSQDEAWYAYRPLYAFERQPVGVGDMVSGIFLVRYLSGDSLQQALTHTLAASDAVLKATFAANAYELKIIEAQEEIAHPTKSITPTAL